MPRGKGLVRSQKTEDRSQKTEGERQKQEARSKEQEGQDTQDSNHALEFDSPSPESRVPLAPPKLR